MVKIVAMSTICVDVFDNTDEIRLGGEALNFAMTISNYAHVIISLMGAVGDDDIGRKAVECIKARKNIDMSCVHMIDNGKTATNKIYHDVTGNRYFKEDSWDGGVYQDFKLSEYLNNQNINMAMEEGSLAASNTLAFLGGFACE